MNNLTERIMSKAERFFELNAEINKSEGASKDRMDLIEGLGLRWKNDLSADDKFEYILLCLADYRKNNP